MWQVLGLFQKRITCLEKHGAVVSGLGCTIEGVPLASDTSSYYCVMRVGRPVVNRILKLNSVHYLFINPVLESDTRQN
jgi:hypothetical protein